MNFDVLVRFPIVRGNVHLFKELCVGLIVFLFILGCVSGSYPLRELHLNAICGKIGCVGLRRKPATGSTFFFVHKVNEVCVAGETEKCPRSPSRAEDGQVY